MSVSRVSGICVLPSSSISITASSTFYAKESGTDRISTAAKTAISAHVVRLLILLWLVGTYTYAY